MHRNTASKVGKRTQTISSDRSSLCLGLAAPSLQAGFSPLLSLPLLLPPQVPKPLRSPQNHPGTAPICLPASQHLPCLWLLPELLL